VQELLSCFLIRYVDSSYVLGVPLKRCAHSWKVFGANTAATRVLPALVALSALGNLIAVTFVSAKGKELRKIIALISDSWDERSKARNREGGRPAILKVLEQTV
jgi:hypothetical protein